MPDQAPAVKLLLTAPEAAKALAIGQRKLWELTNRGIIRAVRIGRAVRYDLRDLEAFIAAQKEGGGR
jgi:excisionase family DNA binding protein